MKSDAKRKVWAQRQYINKTGGGLPSVQNNLEFKITSLYGRNHFDGLQGVRECGFPGRKFASNPLLKAIPEKPLQNNSNETSLETAFEIDFHGTNSSMWKQFNVTGPNYTCKC